MTIKITVGLQQKIGQPHYGSLGASCALELPLEQAVLADPVQLAARIEDAYQTCRQSIQRQLAHSQAAAGDACCEQPPARSGQATGSPTQPANGAQQARPATAAQLRAIAAIAPKTDVLLNSELDRRYGVQLASDLSLTQASEMIDLLKSRIVDQPQAPVR